MSDRSTHRLIRGTLALLAAWLVTAACGMFNNAAWAINTIRVGKNFAGQLKVLLDYTPPAPVLSSSNPNVAGWASDRLGFVSIFTDDVFNDLHPLPANSSINLVVVGGDVQMHVYNPAGSAHVPVGGTWPLGVPYFDQHPLWHISPGAYGNAYSIELKLHDSTGQVTDSDVFTLKFAPACMGDIDRNAIVDIDDMLAVINQWGSCPLQCQTDCPADTDASCKVNIDDLLAVVTHWGVCH
jgi:hypothetical protein